LLTRYLRQLKIDATPYPVRPKTKGDAEPGTPVGYTGAVVRVQVDDVEQWIDPSCTVCAIGEVAPDLWGGQVLSVDLDRLPEAPAGSHEVETDEDGKRVRVVLSGPEAVAIRQWLASMPLDVRSTQLAERFGGPGARLESLDGLTTQGAEIQLVIGR